MEILILGAGLVGSPMAIDLSKDKGYNVTVVDLNEYALKKLSSEYPASTLC